MASRPLFQLQDCFRIMERSQFPGDVDIHNTYRQARKDQRTLLCKFLNDVEIDEIKKFCSAADSDEKSFWKLLKEQYSSSQMSAFLVNGKLITRENVICYSF